MKLTKIFKGETGVRSPRKRGNVILIHPMRYKSQIVKYVVLQCLLDKYVITYQNIWGDGVLRAMGLL